MDYNVNYNNQSSDNEAKENQTNSTQSSSSGRFKNDAEEQMWKNQVRSECVHSYRSRMR